MELELLASIARVTLKATSENGVYQRRCIMAFDAELDASIAGSLGLGAKRALPALKAGDMQRVIIGIDRVVAQAVLVAGADTCKVDRLRGTKATLEAADEDCAPTVRLEFETWYHDEIWVFLGRNCGLMARLTFTPTQLEIEDMISTSAASAAKNLA
jgi:hypothetical protein